MTEPTREQLATQVRYLEAEVTDLRRRLDETARSVARPRDPAGRRPAVPGGRLGQNERLAQTLRDARDQITTLKEEVDRLAQPPAGFGTFLGAQRRRLRRRLHRRAQAARQREPRRRARRPRARPGGHAQRGPQRRRRPRLRAGRRGRDAQGDPRRRRARPGDRQRRRGARRPPRRAAARRGRHHPRRRLAAARHPRRLRLRGRPEVGGRGARPRGGARHRLHADRRPHHPDRRDPRRRRAALPAPRAVQGPRAQAAEGRAALRPARLRQDADRQGGRQLAGQEGRRAHRGVGEVLLPQHQGPRAAQQVRRRDRAPHPPGLPAGAREGRRWAPRSSCSSTRWTRSSAPAAPGVSSDVENTIVPAAAQRDRRRRGAGERARHRCLQPRGHDRPRDPATRVAST